MHNRKRLICREQKILPGAFYRAPGKGILCRVPGLAAPGKERPPAKQPLPGAGHSANSSRRQKLVFAGCRPLGKIWPPAKMAGLTSASSRQPLPGATPLGTRQRIFFFKFLCQVPHDLLCRVPWVAPGNFFFVFFTPLFCGDLLQ